MMVNAVWTEKILYMNLIENNTDSQFKQNANLGQTWFLSRTPSGYAQKSKESIAGSRPLIV